MEGEMVTCEVVPTVNRSRIGFGKWSQDQSGPVDSEIYKVYGWNFKEKIWWTLTKMPVGKFALSFKFQLLPGWTRSNKIKIILFGSSIIIIIIIITLSTEVSEQ